MLTLRHESPGDREAIARVIREAFDGEDEVVLVDALRDAGHLLLSMVAEDEGEIVGHIAYSPMRLEPEEPAVAAVALGPVAVFSARQRGGIGSKLIAESLQELPVSGCELVVLLGDPAYYSRFGFVPASSRGVLRPEDPADHVSIYLQVLELKHEAIRGVRRRAVYGPEFQQPRQAIQC